jgi:hypothetical protein
VQAGRKVSVTLRTSRRIKKPRSCDPEPHVNVEISGHHPITGIAEAAGIKSANAN